MAGSGLFDTYDASPAFCEVSGRKDDPEIQRLFFKRLNKQTRSNLARRKKRAEEELFNLGITFTVYFGEDTVDRVLPFDVIPRPITAADWAELETGVTQRIAALNAFLARVDGGRIANVEALDGFFAAIGDGVVTGPTLTNVNDFRAILVEPPG